MLIEVWVVKTVLMSQVEITTLLGTELEAIHITFLQIICLYFAHVLRLCAKLNLKDTSSGLDLCLICGFCLLVVILVQ